MGRFMLFARGRRHVLVGTIFLIGLLGAAIPAAAAVQSKSLDFTLKGTTTKTLFDTGPQVCDDCYPDDGIDPFIDDPGPGAWGVGAELSAAVKVRWENPVSMGLTYNDTLLRQGETLDSKLAESLQDGTATGIVSVSGAVGLYNDVGSGWQPTDHVTNGTWEKELGSISCSIPLNGHQKCEIGEEDVTLFEIPIFPPFLDVGVNVKATLDLEMDGDGIVTVRKIDTGAQPSGWPNRDLNFNASPMTIDDPTFNPCTEPAGNDVNYSLTGIHYTGTSPKVSTTISLRLIAELIDPVPDVPFTIYSHTFDLLTFPDLELSAPDAKADLGPLQPDNRPPVVGTPVAPNGDEGSQIQFHVDATDNCGPPAVRWYFSDGGIGFGTDPKHTFTDNGHYTGLVTATDDTGNSTTKTFALDISNVKASVNAGPDTSADWGRPVAFNGQATDPASGDQPTLQYTWDFGDGSPSASGGPSVVHSYAGPGTYTAKLTVCDKDGACNDDTRDITITKRDTTTSYLGDTAGTFDTPATLGASLVDEYGQNVNARSVTFNVGSDGPLTALTNSSGIATKSYTPTLAAGSYTGTSAFAGDSLYNSSTSSNSFAVAKKATTIVYTGATTGAPNKVIVLSATLKDATGKPLAGRTISFQLGSQSATATTDANGVASTTLKLTQKNGTYTVSATYTPGAGDAPFYVGSSQGVIFKLQAK
jgi:PKD repeat protein